MNDLYMQVVRQQRNSAIYEFNLKRNPIKKKTPKRGKVKCQHSKSPNDVRTRKITKKNQEY